MTRFSASDAALEGFQVIRAQWRVVIGWVAFNLLAILGMVIGIVILGVIIVIVAGGDSSVLGATVGGPVVTVGTIIVQLMIATAVLRLILHPEDRGFLYLRVSADEVRVVVASVVLLLGLAALALGAVFLARAVRPVGAGGPIVVGVIALAVGYWLCMRLGLVLPMSVIERRIDFARSWRLTRSNAWSLTGMTLLAGTLGLLVSVVVWGLFFLLTLSVVGFQELGNLAGPEGLQRHPGLFLLQAIAPFLFGPFAIVIAWAPWAAAYKALSAPEIQPES
jgi:hypothetical protein